jgi:hypothetical protein
MSFNHFQLCDTVFRKTRFGDPMAEILLKCVLMLLVKDLYSLQTNVIFQTGYFIRCAYITV